MNKFYYSFTFIAIIAIIINASYSTGPGTAASSGCTCHGASSTATVFTITGMPNNYINNTTYPVTVTVTNASQVEAGFYLATNIGSFAGLPSDVSYVTNPTVINHNMPKAITAGSASWSFNWVSPASGTTPYALTGYGNAVNGNNNSTGDQWSALQVILPLRITSFTAVQKENKVAVQWRVEEEENINKYVLERSTDNITFQEIAWINPKGDGQYTYEDNNILSVTKLYYRVKLIDIDGNTTYSETIESALNNQRKVELTPTLLESTNELRISGYEGEELDVYIFDMQGRFVHKGKTISLKYKAPELNTGSYLVLLQNGNHILYKGKIIKK